MNNLNSNVHDSFKLRLKFIRFKYLGGHPYYGIVDCVLLYLHLLAQYNLGSNLLKFHISLLLNHLRTYSDTSVAYELDSP